MDEIDRQIVRYLQGAGRLTWTELGAKVALSTPAVAERVRRLEQRGVIRGYVALVDPVAVDAGVLAFLFLRVRGKVDLERIRGNEVIQECHQVAGRYAYVLKARVHDLAELRAVVEEICALGDVEVEIVIGMQAIKETPAVRV